jgi:ubiquinone biosynthesis protein UbiJ
LAGDALRDKIADVERFIETTTQGLVRNGIQLAEQWAILDPEHKHHLPAEFAARVDQTCGLARDVDRHRDRLDQLRGRARQIGLLPHGDL